LGNNYSYDADGKISGSNAAAYTRDPFGQRVRKDFGGIATEYYYFGGQLLATHNPSSGAWMDYVYAGNRLIAEHPGTPTANPIYRIGDHLDSLAEKTDASGNLLGANDFSPYGELVSSSAPDLLLFTQHERDTENSTDSTLYRQYASTQGRWLSPDPYNGSYNLADPQSLNRYTYLTARPQASVDPTGLFQLPGGDGGDGEDGGEIGSIFEEVFNFFFGGGGGPHGNPHSTVNTSFGNPSINSNGTFVFRVTSNLPYSDAGIGTGAGFGVAAAAVAPFVFSVTAFDFSLAAPSVSATVAPSNNNQPDSRTLPSCLSLGIQTVGDDLNPFSPSPFTLFDVAASGATAASAMKFNQALEHSITRGLTYPNKSSIFRGLMSASETFAKVAEVLPIFALDAAVIHGIYTELTAQCSYP
jgi:RHS repeat-associated protein